MGWFLFKPWACQERKGTFYMKNVPDSNGRDFTTKNGIT